MRPGQDGQAVGAQHAAKLRAGPLHEALEAGFRVVKRQRRILARPDPDALAGQFRLVLGGDLLGQRMGEDAAGGAIRQ